MKIGAIIKKQRVLMKLTQEEFAARLNVTPQAVSRWEKEISLPDITLVPRIADLLKKSCDDLLKGKEHRITHYALAGGILIDASEVLIQNAMDDVYLYHVPLGFHFDHSSMVSNNFFFVSVSKFRMAS